MVIKIKIVELLDAKARITFEGEGNTYMNVLTDELLKDPDVDVAQYKRVFSFSDPELVLTTRNGKAPLDALKDAAERLSSASAGLRKELLTASV